MAYQYWYKEETQRTTFISFEGGYHGDTLGATCQWGQFSVAFDR